MDSPMFCPKCGAQNTDAATTCSACSTVLPRADATSQTAFAAEKIKATSQDAWIVFRRLLLNPVGDIDEAYQSLGSSRALGVGVAFGLATSVFSAIAFMRLLSSMTDGFSAATGIGTFLKLTLIFLVPLLSLTLASLAIRSLARAGGSVGQDCFIAGASLLPLGFAALLSSILGLANVEIIVAVLVIAQCITILMLYTGLTKIYAISDAVATISVPAMLLMSGWLSKVFYVMLLTNT
jgi:hypothetical protein